MESATRKRWALQSLPVGVPKRVSESDEREIHDPLVRRILSATLLVSVIEINM